MAKCVTQLIFLIYSFNRNKLSCDVVMCKLSFVKERKKIFWKLRFLNLSEYAFVSFVSKGENRQKNHVIVFDMNYYRNQKDTNGLFNLLN